MEINPDDFNVELHTGSPTPASLGEGYARQSVSWNGTSSGTPGYSFLPRETLFTHLIRQERAPWWMRLFGRKYRTRSVPIRIQL